MLEDEKCQKAKLEEEIAVLQSQLLQLSFEADEVKKYLFQSYWLSIVGEIIWLCMPYFWHGWPPDMKEKFKIWSSFYIVDYILFLSELPVVKSVC